MVKRVAQAMKRHYVGPFSVANPPGLLWAIFNVDSNRPAAVCKTRKEARELCREANARAVIEALREPTDVMVLAGDERGDPTKMWQAMIDAALTEPEAPSPR